MQGFTHYALINEDKDVIAVVKADKYRSRTMEAIEDETGGEIDEIKFEEIDFTNYRATATIDDGSSYVVVLRPTWEY